jgi:hypothetical protein
MLARSEGAHEDVHVAGPYRKSLNDPDELVTDGGTIQKIVEIGDFTVGLVSQEPGWCWSRDIRPLVGTEWCEARHVGVCLEGTVCFELRDGTRFEVGRTTSTTSRRVTTRGSSATNGCSRSTGRGWSHGPASEPACTIASWPAY